MVDRVILHPSKRPGKRSGKDIGERVQIVLRGNQLLTRADEPLATREASADAHGVRVA
ncbi:MAG TPA: hypothetical protein VE289_07535 [Gaiellaceae bacterium]|jgi:hypothetical protein|nr:hypothetical protein [Gaiellaceae bacterium]